MTIPPLVHLPIFIFVSLVLRESCSRSLVALADSHSVVLDTLQSSNVQLALESFAWCPSLAQVDPYTILPLLVSLSALSNVEIQAAARKQIGQAPSSVLTSTKAVPETEISAGTSELTKRIQLSRPAPLAHPALLQLRKIGTVSKSHAPQPSSSSSTEISSSFRNNAITNILRFASILFLPVAAYAPVVSEHIFAILTFYTCTNAKSIVSRQSICTG